MSLPTISGEFRVGTDPELRFTPSGMAICDIRAVATRRKQDGDNWVDANTFWTKITGFKKQAENMAESFKSGDLVVVVGQVETQEYEIEGNKRIAVNVMVHSIGHATSFDPSTSIKQERQRGGGGQQSQPQSQPSGPPDPDEPPF